MEYKVKNGSKTLVFSTQEAADKYKVAISGGNPKTDSAPKEVRKPVKKVVKKAVRKPKKK